MLHGIASLLAIVGLLAIVLGGLWMLVQAFSTSLLWGFGCLLLAGPVSLAFLIVHWRRARDPFFLQLLGVAAIVVAAVMDRSVLHGH